MVYNCYIDEAGDEGIETGGSQWFMIGAIIVPIESDLDTCAMVSKVRSRLNRDDTYVVHWKNMNHRQKLCICDEYMKQDDWEFCCAIADKTHPKVTQASGLKRKSYLYFYLTRFLLERLSWYARDNENRKAIPVFEHRTNISYEAMRDYFNKLHQDETVQISWDNIEGDKFRILPKRNHLLLQAADNLCGTVKDALEPDIYGYVESRYVLSIQKRLYRHNGRVLSYGLKFLHDERDMDSIIKKHSWLKSIE